MIIKKALVTGNHDLSRSGFFTVREESTEFELIVRYVSPFLSEDFGGFIAIPEINSMVLICQPDNDTEWFYLGSIAGFTLKDAVPGSLPRTVREPLPDKRLYKARGRPQRITLKSPGGNQLVLSDEYAPSYFNSKAELKSSSGKKVALIDSPQVDSIIIQNEYGDRLKISTSQNGSMGRRGIEVECQGAVNIISRESDINLTVIDGKEINIVNKSTGSKRINSNDPTPGNINIESERADVNLTTKGPGGDIHLVTEGANGNIVLESQNGIVQIRGANGVDISGADSSGNIQSDIVIRGTRIFLN